MKKIRLVAAILIAAVLLVGCSGKSYKAGVDALKKEDYKEAAVQFQMAVDEKKNLADSYRGLGIALYETEDYEGAYNAFEHALKEGTEANGTLYNFLGCTELKLNKGKEALDSFQKGLEDESCSKQLVQEMEYNVIVAYEQMQDTEKAKEKLNEYVQKYPDDVEAAKEAELFQTQ